MTAPAADCVSALDSGPASAQLAAALPAVAASEPSACATSGTMSET